ncbi:MAG: Ni/Co efflux regulator RcnB [Candidatus Nanohaloarchaea archaeon]|jgi:Ni/Co efflux regulator RcnB
MKQALIAFLALGFVASAAAIPAHAQAAQNQEVDQKVETGSQNQSSSEDLEEARQVERGPMTNSEQPVRRGPPAFVQDLVPQHALQNMPDFFW